MFRVSVALMVLGVSIGLACEDDEPEVVCEVSRTESEACCPELGIDACGAGLVCAALDGRVWPSCYREYSRVDGSDCTEDRLCASGSCGSSDRCQGSPGASCSAKLGCADDSMGFARKCIEAFPGVPLCLRTGALPGQECTFDVECTSNSCGCGFVSLTCCEPP